jgi:FKBP-type peptidyl-prolyl cis-trans isomerase (trigger factor)
VLQQLRQAEQIEVGDEEIEAEILKMLAQFGEQAEKVRGAIDTPSMRTSLRNDLTEKATIDRLVAIARGEAPELNPAAPAEATETG